MFTCIRLMTLSLFIYASTWALDEFVGPFDSWTNIKTLGAVGNGVADDFTAIQKALDSMCTSTPIAVLYFPAGTYRITQSLQLPRTGIVVSNKPMAYRIVGEDPTKVTILWDGPNTTDSYMVQMAGNPNTSYERISWDGANKVSECFRQMWIFTMGQPTTFVMHIDEIFKNAKYGIRSPNYQNIQHQMDAEHYIEQCKFINLTEAGIQQNSANNQNWHVFYCSFEDCKVGAQANGYRELYINNCNFLRSTTADVMGCNAVRNCYSYQSQMFAAQQVHPIDDIRAYYSNTIVDPVTSLALDDANASHGVFMVDNVFASLSNATGPIVKGGGRTVAIGNTFTASNPISATTLTNIDNTTVSRSTLNLTAPTLPDFRPKVTRKIFEVARITKNSSSYFLLQAAIDSAVAWAATHAGSRPVVHFSGAGNLEATITIPANTDIQLMGDAMTSKLCYMGPEGFPVFSINGPTKFTVSYATFYGFSATSVFSVKNCDQQGSRIFFNDVTFPQGLFVNGANDVDVTAHWFGGGGGVNGRAQIKVVGGSRSSSTARTALFGAPNIAGQPAFEIVKNGRLLLQDSYSEMMWGCNQFIYCHGIGTQPGIVSFEITSNLTSAKNSPYYNFDNWSGTAAMLSGNYAYTSTSISAANATNAGLLNLLALGNTFPMPASPYPAQSHILYTNHSPTLSANITDSLQFIRDAFAFRRSQKPLPIPLAAVPSSASDLQFFRLKQDGDNNGFDVYIEGSNADTSLGTVLPVSNYFSSNAGFERGVFEGWMINGSGLFLDTTNKSQGKYGVKIMQPLSGGTKIMQWIGDLPSFDTCADWYAEFDVKVDPTVTGGVRMWTSLAGNFLEDSVVITESAISAKNMSRMTVTNTINGFHHVHYQLGKLNPTGAPKVSIALEFFKYSSGSGAVYGDNFVFFYSGKCSVPVLRGRYNVAVRPGMRFTHNRLIFSGLPENTQVSLFTMAGRLVASQQVKNAELEMMLPLTGISQGSYMVLMDLPTGMRLTKSFMNIR